MTDLATGAARFCVSEEGVISDSQTGLDWFVGPDQETNYAEAEQFIATIDNLDGGGWHMLTRAELKSLYQEGVGERNMDPVFMTNGWYVWAVPRDSSSAWNFFFNGHEDWYDHNFSGSHWVFGLRSRPR